MGIWNLQFIESLPIQKTILIFFISHPFNPIPPELNPEKKYEQMNFPRNLSFENYRQLNIRTHTSIASVSRKALAHSFMKRCERNHMTFDRG